jgi:hypothetical protein
LGWKLDHFRSTSILRWPKRACRWFASKRAIWQVLRAQTMNKTDRNDARGLALMMRVGLFKPVHIKSDRSQRLNVLLQARKVLKSKLLTSRLTCGASSKTLA